MRQSISVKVNGRERQSEVEPRMLLVQYLREGLNLTGTHIGCDTGQCGACTVLLNGQAVKSCMVLAVQADGADVSTVEGLAQGDQYHPVQQAFWDNHGLQCGFCTPGFMMATVSLLKRIPNPTDDQIREELEGNLCRCTGYQNIVASVRSAAAMMQGSHLDHGDPLSPDVQPLEHSQPVHAEIGDQHAVGAAEKYETRED